MERAPHIPSRRETHAVEPSHERLVEKIQELEARSRYMHTMLQDGREEIASREGEKFFIRKLVDPKDPAVKKMHALMVKEFGKEESEALYWLRESIKQRLNDYQIIETPDGVLVGFTNSQLLALEPVANQRDEVFCFLAHIAISDEQHGKGLATELFRHLYGDTLAEARRRGVAVKGFIGEAVDEVESFNNHMSWYRVYLESESGDVYEVPYFCPPVDFTDEGDVVEGERPDHLMIGLVDSADSISPKELLRMVKSMYEEYIATEEDYTSPEAYQKARAYVVNLYDVLEKRLSEARGNTLFFMNKEQREAKRAQLALAGRRLVEVETT